MVCKRSLGAETRHDSLDTGTHERYFVPYRRKVREEEG